MNDLPSIIATLKGAAASTRADAYASIGGLPGPGLDILIIPSKPITLTYGLKGLTPAGKGWIKKFYPDLRITAGREMRTMKEALADWELTWKMDWSNNLEGTR